MLSWQRRHGFRIDDLRRLLDHIEEDGGVALWFATGSDGRDFADVRFYLESGEVSEVYYTLLVDEAKTNIERVSREKV